MGSSASCGRASTPRWSQTTCDGGYIDPSTDTRQQGVERRLQSLQTEIEEIKSVNAELVRRMAGPSPSNLGITPAGRPPSPPRPPPALLRDSSLVEHLIPLRDILYPVFQELQEPTPLDVSLDDATVLWERWAGGWYF